MQRYDVSGMSCAACAARVERAVNSVDGVSSCAVNLLTNSMGVEGTADPRDVIAAVVAAGYGASQKDGNGISAVEKGRKDDELRDSETPKLLSRLIVSAVFLLVLMYFSMGYMMWGWPLPAFFENNHIAVGLVQLLLSGIIMVINQRFFISGYKSLWHRAPNMDTLVALGSTAAFVYSTYALFAMTGAVSRGDHEAAMGYMMDMYFESAAMILTLITVGKTLEAHSKGKTTNALKSLMKLAPQTATLLRDGREVTVPVSQVKSGDIFVVRAGESIPTDGVVTDGESAVNESALTGESIPVDKAPGDSVSAAMINTQGFLTCRATRVGEDTTLSQIIKMVSDAAATKAPIAKIADKVSGVFVPIVMSIAAVTTIVWLLLGREFGYSLARGISVLVISCPCALGLATPVAVMVGNGLGAKNGILFKTAAALEETGRVSVVALDKTGTITAGEPRVTDIIPADGFDENDLLKLAVTLEKKSEHPLAAAVLKKAEELGICAGDALEFKVLPGNGLAAKIGGDDAFGGNASYVGRVAEISDSIRERAETLAEAGKTPLYFGIGGKLAGVIAVADVIKEDSPRAIRELRQMGIEVVMLTGDNERTATAIGAEAGVDSVIAAVLPDGKEEEIKKLRTHGKVAMVGDGINDAPALTRADIGIAIGAGADVAIDAADVVLMNSRLSDVPAAIRLSRAALRNIHENLFWAFFYNAIGIPLAAGVFIPLGITLDPMFGAAAMSLSSFCVVSNALRLNLFNIHDARHYHRRRVKRTSVAATDDPLMIDSRTIRVEGMMCSHCEGTVKTALEGLDGVDTAQADHESGIVTVTLRPGVKIGDRVLKKVITSHGYKVKSIE